MKEAAKRGLLNLRRTPEALEQLVDAQRRARCSPSSASSRKAELESRYHVRMERYVKDMLIEMHTLQRDGRHAGAAGGVRVRRRARARRRRNAVTARASRACRRSPRRTSVGALIESLRERRDALGRGDREGRGAARRPARKQARFLTSDGRRGDGRPCARSRDAARADVADDCWPLPKYREMLFPV